MFAVKTSENRFRLIIFLTSQWAEPVSLTFHSALRKLASVFCKLLQTDPYGRISIMQFFNYVMRKVWLHQTRIGLSLYDVAGQGYLKESVSFFP
jgi:hypothetical protein